MALGSVPHHRRSLKAAPFDLSSPNGPLRGTQEPHGVGDLAVDDESVLACDRFENGAHAVTVTLDKAGRKATVSAGRQSFGSPPIGRLLGPCVPGSRPTFNKCSDRIGLAAETFPAPSAASPKGCDMASHAVGNGAGPIRPERNYFPRLVGLSRACRMMRRRRASWHGRSRTVPRRLSGPATRSLPERATIRQLRPLSSSGSSSRVTGLRHMPSLRILRATPAADWHLRHATRSSKAGC